MSGPCTHDSTCGTCGRTWSSVETPTPAARCPFEYDHITWPADPKTKRGAIHQYDQIIRACRRDLAGGLAFGMDWSTIRAVFPERYDRVQALRAMYKDLPA